MGASHISFEKSYFLLSLSIIIIAGFSEVFKFSFSSSRAREDFLQLPLSLSIYSILEFSEVLKLQLLLNYLRG